MEIDVIRFFLAFILGYFLSLSGSLSQLVTNNSIASPSTLGMDGMAVLFVIFAYFLPEAFLFNLPYELVSFILFNICFFILVFLFFIKKKPVEVWEKFNISQLVIMGMAFNLFVGAIFSIIQFLFISYNFQFPSGLWFGQVKNYENYYLSLYLILFLSCLIFSFLYAKKVSILNYGSGMAYGLRLNVSGIQKGCLLLSLYLTGTVICFFGVFSFLSLVFPHLVRSHSFFKNSMAKELTYGSLLSGVVLALLDLTCFNGVINGAELPVGMVTSVIGAFFLIVFLLKSKISKV